MGEKLGRAKEVVGWATGDRQVEAEGRAEKDVADPAVEASTVTEDQVEDEKEAVRRERLERQPGRTGG